MPAPGFEEFCCRLCEAVGVPPPALDGSGPEPPAFTFEYEGVPIAWTQASLADASSAVMLVDFGPAPAQAPEAAFRVLLESNFMTMGAGGPGFGINPATGHVVYCQGFAVHEADPVALARSLVEITATVLQWRASQFLLSGQPAPAAPAVQGQRP